MKASNDKLPQPQCKYSVTSGEFRFQNAIFSSWALSKYTDEISWICIFQTKKLPLSPLVKNILGVLLSWNVTIPITNFRDISHRRHYYGRRFFIYDLYIYLKVISLLKKNKCMKIGKWVPLCEGGCLQAVYVVLWGFLQIRNAHDTLMSCYQMHSGGVGLPGLMERINGDEWPE